jgi:hypothetical protein
MVWGFGFSMCEQFSLVVFVMAASASSVGDESCLMRLVRTVRSCKIEIKRSSLDKRDVLL